MGKSRADILKNKKAAASYTYGRAAIKSDQRKRPPPKSGSNKTVKQLLGEFYGDKEFLEKLLKETGRFNNEVLCVDSKY